MAPRLPGPVPPHAETSMTLARTCDPRMKTSSDRRLTPVNAGENLPEAVVTRQLYVPARLTPRRTPRNPSLVRPQPRLLRTHNANVRTNAPASPVCARGVLLSPAAWFAGAASRDRDRRWRRVLRVLCDEAVAATYAIAGRARRGGDAQPPAWSASPGPIRASMTLRGTARAATIALAVAVATVVPTSMKAQDLACDRGDQEVRALEFRGNRALNDDDLALRVTTTPSAW